MTKNKKLKASFSWILKRTERELSPREYLSKRELSECPDAPLVSNTRQQKYCTSTEERLPVTGVTSRYLPGWKNTSFYLVSGRKKL